MRVIVVGGGIGGLGAAIGLSQTGHEVLVFERAPQIDVVGAGLTLFANAMAALERLGVAAAVRAKGSAARRSAILTSSGRELMTIPSDLLEGAVAIHRADLQRALLDGFGNVRLAADVTSVEQTGDAVVVTLGDGTKERADLLIGADGVRSMVRDSVAPTKPRYGGYTAWRGVSPVRVVAGQLTESWGVGERFGLVDLGSRTYWFATANSPEGEPEDPAERKSSLMRRFARWHSPITTVLDATPEASILRNDVYFLEPLTRLSAGRIVLVGDAAHATTPGAGQGAAQALEDAVVLSSELAAADDPADALARYDAIRRPRAALTLKLSRQADRAAQLASPIGCRLRNALVTHIPQRVQRRQLGRLVWHVPETLHPTVS